MPVVDVIIPTRNRFSMTVEAISSVLGQTFDDWHLYVVDDASDDGSDRALENRFGGHDKISLIRRTVPGRAAVARQTGFDAGSAPWVATLDSDDLWHPEKLQKQLATASEHDVVLTWHSWLRPDGSVRVTRCPQGRGKVSPLLTSNVDVALMRRDLIVRVGGFLDARTPTEADENIDFFVRLLSAADVVVVEEVLAWCRDHGAERTSDLMTPASLQRIVDARRPVLEPWPEDFGPLLCRLGARYLAAGQRRDGLRYTAEGFRRTPVRQRRRVIREFGAHALRSVLRIRAARS